MATVAWDLAATAQFAEWNLRAHAHTLGFTGQIITKSRHFSTTFRELREVRARYMAPNNTSDPIQGTYSYAGRGYDDPRAAQLAALFHSMMLDLRREAGAHRRAELASTAEVSS